MKYYVWFMHSDDNAPSVLATFDSKKEARAFLKTQTEGKKADRVVKTADNVRLFHNAHNVIWDVAYWVEKE